MKVNAVFEGGGIKAIGLLGAISEAERQGVKFHHMAGTSSGAIIASLLSAGYTADEVKTLVLEKPFTEFLSRSAVFSITFIGPATRLLLKKGLYSGDPLEEWVRQKLLVKGISTFGDLETNKLRIVASDISRSKLLVLPEDIDQFDVDPMQLSIASAVRMSTSIPYFFDPIVMRIQSEKCYIVDGGILSNFPLWIFDREYHRDQPLIPTLGFQLVGKSYGVPKQVYGPITMFQALFSTMMNAHDERYIEEHNRFRTIKIPTLGVGTTEFDISEEKSQELFASGEYAARQFFNRWSITGYLNQFYKQVSINSKA